MVIDPPTFLDIKLIIKTIHTTNSITEFLIIIIVTFEEFSSLLFPWTSTSLRNIVESELFISPIVAHYLPFLKRYICHSWLLIFSPVASNNLSTLISHYSIAISLIPNPLPSIGVSILVWNRWEVVTKLFLFCLVCQINRQYWVCFENMHILFSDYICPIEVFVVFIHKIVILFISMCCFNLIWKLAWFNMFALGSHIAHLNMNHSRLHYFIKL